LKPPDKKPLRTTASNGIRQQSFNSFPLPRKVRRALVPKNRTVSGVYTRGKRRYISTVYRTGASRGGRRRAGWYRSTRHNGFGWKELRVSSSVEEKVIAIVSEQLNIPKEDIKLESAFVDDLKADSLDIVELVMEFEDEFGIQIPDEDYEKIRTVGDAIKYIQEKQ
jgi:acyl carrier protein